MIWSNPKLSPDARLLLERERFITVLPTATRARARVRARAALAAGVTTRSVLPRAPLVARWAAAAAGLACVATVAAALAAAYEVGLRGRPTAPPIAAPPPADLPTPHPSLAAQPVVSPAAAPTLTEAPAAAPSRARAVRDELHLLQQARAAVAREDFAAATLLLAEHARRFKTGRLAEEREALRVRSLTGLGHRDDASRAAADFVARFPRSPLLPTVRQMPDWAP